MTVYVSPLFAAGTQFFTDLGVINAGGKINTYQAGTTTLQATYTDNTGTVANANPIVLGSNGRFTTGVWHPAGQAIKYVITDVNNNQLGPTMDNIPGIGDPAF
jgi:hypothetical protein